MTPIDLAAERERRRQPSRKMYTPMAAMTAAMSQLAELGLLADGALLVDSDEVLAHTHRIAAFIDALHDYYLKTEGAKDQA